MNKLQNKISSLSEKLHESDDVILSLTVELKEERRKCEELTSTKSKMEQKINRLYADIENLEKENNMLRQTSTKISQIESPTSISVIEVVERHNNEVHKLNKKINELREEYIKCAMENESLLKHLKELQDFKHTSSDYKQDERDDMRSVYFSLDVELELENLRDELKKIKKERDELRKRQNCIGSSSESKDCCDTLCCSIM